MFAPKVAKSTAKTVTAPTPQRQTPGAQWGRDFDREGVETEWNAPGRAASQPGHPWKVQQRPLFDFSKISIEPPVRPSPTVSLPLQAKLKVGAVNDPLEQEADKVADQVLRMPSPQPALASVPPQVSRKCCDCEE